MPEFNLGNDTFINIGANKPLKFEYLPFTSSQNAKFLIRIKDENGNAPPNWLQINENSMTISIIASTITLVGTTTLKFEAQLITVSIPDNNYMNYKTQVYSSIFHFENSNWKLQNITSKPYLVVNKLSYFYFIFSDNEADNVIVKMDLNEQVDSFVTFDKTTNTSQVLLQSNVVSESVINLLFFYTDSYHQDLSFWNNFTISVNLFASEPPVFNSALENVHTNRWHNLLVQLPSISDPDTSNLK